MANVPQVIVTLDPETGGLVAELPGFMATRRKVELRGDAIGATLRRILEAQLENKSEIGQDGAPTQAQVRHWEQHGVWADERCRFCLAEGRARPSAQRVRRAYTISGGKGANEVEVRVLKPGASGSHKTLNSRKNAEDIGL